MNTWRRWLPGAKHGVARGVGVLGRPGQTDPELLATMLGRCEQLRTWAAAFGGFELQNIPDDLPLLDRAFDQEAELAGGEGGDPARIGQLGNELGLYLGTVIVGTVPGARWRVWPNGHPVVRLSSRRDVDVVAIGNERARGGSPLLAEAYADAAGGPLR